MSSQIKYGTQNPVGTQATGFGPLPGNVSYTPPQKPTRPPYDPRGWFGLGRTRRRKSHHKHKTRRHRTSQRSRSRKQRKNSL